MASEVFLPYETRGRAVQEATHVRSTLIVSSIQALRGRGLFDAYVAHLPAEHRSEIISLIAGTWSPIHLGFAHYSAANKLGLDSRSIEDLGAAVGERINKSMLSVVVKMSKEAGLTPWSALARAHRLRDLTWKGSDLSVLKLGPKEARLDWVGMPYARVPYYVDAYGGFLRALLQLFCTRIYARVVPEQLSESAVSYRLSWV